MDIHNSIMDVHNCKPITNKQQLWISIINYGYPNCIMGSDNHILKNLPAQLLSSGKHILLIIISHNAIKDIHNCSPIFTHNAIMDIHNWIMDIDNYDE